MTERFLPIVKLETGKTYTIKTYFNQVNFELYKGKRIIKKNEIEIGGHGELEGKVLNIMNKLSDTLEEKPELNPLITTIYINEDGTIKYLKRK